ncbi:unnamed protein product [Discosporangium mesarthrocarpum]
MKHRNKVLMLLGSWFSLKCLRMRTTGLQQGPFFPLADIAKDVLPGSALAKNETEASMFTTDFSTLSSIVCNEENRECGKSPTCLKCVTGIVAVDEVSIRTTCGDPEKVVTCVDIERMTCCILDLYGGMSTSTCTSNSLYMELVDCAFQTAVINGESCEGQTFDCDAGERLMPHLPWHSLVAWAAAVGVASAARVLF